MPERRNGSRRGPGRVVEKPHNLKKAMSDLLRYCRNDMGVIIIALILSMSGAVLNILGPRQISPAFMAAVRCSHSCNTI